MNAAVQNLLTNWTLYASVVIVACNVVTVLIKPPAPSSRWARLYALVSKIALNIGWAENRLQIGQTGIMVPRDVAPEAKAALDQAGVPRVAHGGAAQ